MADPFATPNADLNERAADLQIGEADAIRKERLRDEEKTRLAGAWLFTAGAMLLILFSLDIADVLNGLKDPGFVLVGEAAAITYLVVGWRIAALDARFPIVGAMVAAPWFLFFPVGTLIVPRLIYTLVSGRGRFIFSENYRDVIRRTPGLKVRWWLIVLTVLLLPVSATIAGLLVYWISRWR